MSDIMSILPLVFHTVYFQIIHSFLLTIVRIFHFGLSSPSNRNWYISQSLWIGQEAIVCAPCLAVFSLSLFHCQQPDISATNWNWFVKQLFNGVCSAGPYRPMIMPLYIYGSRRFHRIWDGANQSSACGAAESAKSRQMGGKRDGWKNREILFYSLHNFPSERRGTKILFHGCGVVFYFIVASSKYLRKHYTPWK